jgi:hypothetical protein
VEDIETVIRSINRRMTDDTMTKKKKDKGGNNDLQNTIQNFKN